MAIQGSERTDASRRQPRVGVAFRSTDLVKALREGLGAWLRREGFKQQGSNGWVRSSGPSDHLIIVAQCRLSGWDSRAGSSFVVEFERSLTPARATGYNRQRLWTLLEEQARREALRINTQVAQTLPQPDQRFLLELPHDVRDHYRRAFTATTQTVDSTDVWFAYYDETDAAIWADFLSRELPPALHAFDVQPPSFFGHRPSTHDRS
ncbi:MAG TPA: hypothetical protein PKV13_11410 [Propionicimonas sp.]|nr:hypothetical protein [Propionicimonas sp.]